MSTPRVLVSVLNWNKAATTLACLEFLRNQAQDNMHVDILVIDNGSDPDEYAKLRDAVDARWVKLLRVEKNLGFTGGHNLAVKMAMEQDYDFIWLLNNDATVEADTLAKLTRAIRSDDRCGAVSPVLSPGEGAPQNTGWGFVIDWRARCQKWLPSAEASMKLHETHPEKIAIAGTAVLLRVAAMREVGLLDDKLFAYYDDNDISARMNQHGWLNKVVFDARAVHDKRVLSETPLYFFYLMYRNELFFWHTHMPAEYRKLLWLKIVNQSLYHINRLRRQGLERQADTALLGVWDFMRGRGGAPDLSRRPPLAIRLAARLISLQHDRQISAAQSAAR